jgi:exopolysaccharide biosynthesis polyprenyl glycosylphosphotransferase
MHGRRKSLIPALDTPVALTLGLAAGIYANRHHVPVESVQTFFGVRVSLLNVYFAAALALLWSRAVELAGLGRSYTLGLGKAVLYAVQLCGLATLAVGVFLVLRHGTDPILNICSYFFAASSSYFVLRLLIMNPRQAPQGRQRVIILGTGRRASRAWRELRVNQNDHCDFLGFVDDREPSDAPPDIIARFLTTTTGLSQYLLRNVVDELVVAVPIKSCYEMAQRAVSIAESVGVRVSCLQDTYTLSLRKSARAEPIVELTPSDHHYHLCQLIKRVADVILASVALIVLAPIFLVIALVVKCTSPGPVFFLQDRFGYHRRVFRMYKFRSMVKDAPNLMSRLEAQNEASGPIFKIRNDPRITPFGKFIRKTSLDELPQLWNVVRGDMSLVGPRPMSMRDVSHFNDATLMRRFSVRPGVTGSWQVGGRGSLLFDDWVEFDFGYIEKWSLGLDLKILAQTVPALLKRSGAA